MTDAQFDVVKQISITDMCNIISSRTASMEYDLKIATKKLTQAKENKKLKQMVEDMKADMCSTKSKVLCDYLSCILKKYGEIV